MEGYLHKKGRGQTVSFIRPWARRYFVLDDRAAELRYYEQKDRHSLKGRLLLEGLQVSDSESNSDKQFCFELTTSGDSGVLVLSAPDQQGKDAWIKAFSRVSHSAVRESTVAPGRQPSVVTVDVLIISGGAPVITLSAEATRILPSSKLKLFSTIAMNSTTEMSWSVDSPLLSVDLDDISLTPISATMGSGVFAFNLVIMESTLPLRGTLTFVLQAGSSSASIDISIISPPLTGRLVTSPESGLEMSTTFDIGTSLWTDIELPISYAFGYVTNEGTFLSIQSRSEDTYASMTLPAGKEDDNFKKIMFVKGFNPLEASDVLTMPIVVNRQEVSAAEFSDIVTAQLDLATAETDSNVVKQIVSVAASSMNNVNCSLSPNCTLLGRGQCVKIAHTCGECQPGYIGEDGHDNTACFMAKNSSISNSSIVESCHLNSDCALFQECNTTTEKCFYPSKTCKFDCNGRGDCLFKHAKSGVELEQCNQGETNCFTRCSCDDGFAGETCEHTQADQDAKLKAREDMAIALSNAVAAEPLNTADAVQDLIGMIEALSSNPYELTATACDSITAMVTLALTGVSTLDMAYEDLSTLYATLDDCQTVYIENGDTICLECRRRRFLTSSTEVNNLISQYVTIVSNGIEGGQDIVSGAKKNFRTTNFFSSNTDIMVFDVAQTPAEVAANADKSTLSVDLGQGGTGADVSTSIVESVYQMYSNNESNSLIGNPVRANFLRSSISTMATIQFNLINAVDGVTYGGQLESNETFVTECVTGTFDKKNYTCGSGFLLEHTCLANSTSPSTLTTECPSSTYMPLCGLVIGGQVYTENPDPNGNTSCSVVGYDNVSVTCECNVYILDSNSDEGRRRLDAVGDSGAIEVVSMSAYVADGFVDTLSSSSDWTWEDIGRVWIIIAMVTTMWAFGLFTVFLLSTKRYQNYLAKDQKVGVVEDDITLSDNESKRKFILGYIDQIFPSVFINSTWSWAGLGRAVRTYHRHYTLFTMAGKYANRTRLVTALQLLSLHTMVFWVMAVTFEIQFPVDDGSCAEEDTVDSCLSEKSMFDNDRNKCNWVENENRCEYTEVTLNIRMLLLVILVMAFVQAIFNIPIDILFQDIINAPLAADQDEFKKDEVMNSEDGENGTANERKLMRRRSSLGKERLTTREGLDKEKSEDSSMSFFQRHFRWERTRLVSDTFSDLHDKVVRIEEDTYLRPNTRVALDTAEDMRLVFDYPELVTFVGIQREHLLENNPDAVPDFDEKWGWENGFNDPVRAGGCFKSKQLHEYIKRDVDSSIKIANEKSTKLHRATAEHIGLELMHQFVLDLLGRDTSAAKIFIQKTDEDFRHVSVVTGTMKNLAWAVVILFNMFFLYYMMTMGLTRARDFQVTFVTVCMIQLCFEIFVFETLEVAWVQYIIPHLVVNDVRKRIECLRQQVNYAFDVELSELEHPLDATSYLFVSARLAKEFPQLFESEIILIFSSYLPGAFGERWTNSKSWRTCNAKGVGFTLLVPALAVLQWMGTFSMRAQKAMIHVFQPIVCALGIVLAFFMAANPIWLVVPGAFICFEMYQLFKRKRKPKVNVESEDDVDSTVEKPLKTKPSDQHISVAPSVVAIADPEPEKEEKVCPPIEEVVVKQEEPKITPQKTLKKKAFVGYEIQDDKSDTIDLANVKTNDPLEPSSQVSDDDDDDQTVYDDDGIPTGVAKVGEDHHPPSNTMSRKKIRQDRARSHELYAQFEVRQKEEEKSGCGEEITANSFTTPPKALDPFRVSPMQRSLAQTSGENASECVPSPYIGKEYVPLDRRDMRSGRVHLPPVKRNGGPGSMTMDLNVVDTCSGTNSPTAETDIPHMKWEK